MGDVGFNVMRSVVGFVLLGALASCDFVYSVRRTTSVGPTFDAPAAEQWIRQQPGYAPDSSQPWDGEWMAHVIQRGMGWACLELLNGELSVASLRVGPPAQEELDAWLQLQSELIEALRERFPSLPPASAWQVTNSYLDDELAAAAERQSVGPR